MRLPLGIRKGGACAPPSARAQSHPCSLDSAPFGRLPSTSSGQAGQAGQVTQGWAARRVCPESMWFSLSLTCRFRPHGSVTCRPAFLHPFGRPLPYSTIASVRGSRRSTDEPDCRISAVMHNYCDAYSAARWCGQSGEHNACGPRSGLFGGLGNRGLLDVCLQQISLLAHLRCEAVLWEALQKTLHRSQGFREFLLTS